MVGRSPPKLASVKSEAAGGGGLKGQTLQTWAWEETMVYEMSLQVAQPGEVLTSIIAEP